MLELLLAEKKRCPAAEARDYCKLLYQSEFGAGHMAADPETRLARLRAECATAGVSRGEAPFTDVGGGLLRLHLRALPALKVRLETVSGLFAQACAPRGSIAGLEKKLAMLRENAAGIGPDGGSRRGGDRPLARGGLSGAVAFADLSRALPSRLSPRACGGKALFAPVSGQWTRCLQERGGARVAIDGNSGAGKSTLGALLAAVYGGNLYHMDDFFPATGAQDGAAAGRTRRQCGQGALFQAEVLSHLGAPFSYRPWRCHPGAFAAPVAASPRAVEIVEGVYSLHPDLRAAYDLRVFLAIAPRAQAERIRARSGEAMLKRFVAEWIPLENVYFDRLGVRDCCQLVFSQGAE